MRINTANYESDSETSVLRARRLMARVRRLQLSSALAGDVKRSARYASRARKLRAIVESRDPECACAGV
ncbi:MAG: hypothetical protein K8S99_05695 [Planctomycetes bacterium]|nr:hypothetical protein [Planctomycetota bacterium]